MRTEEAKKGFSLFGKGGAKTKPAAAIFADAVAKFRADEYEAAIKAFRQVLTLDPGFPNVRFNLGGAFLGIERYTDALQWLQEHVSKNKQDAEARALYSKISALATRKTSAATP